MLDAAVPSPNTLPPDDPNGLLKEVPAPNAAALPNAGELPKAGGLPNTGALPKPPKRGTTERLNGFVFYMPQLDHHRSFVHRRSRSGTIECDCLVLSLLYTNTRPKPKWEG